MGEIMLEQLRYDMITGLFHHKKRALLVIISVLLTYVFMFSPIVD